MAGFIFEEGSQAQATAFDGANDTLVFQTLAPADIAVTFNAAAGLQIATITLAGGGQSLNFAATELAGLSNTLFLASGGELGIGDDANNAALSADGADADAVYGLGGNDTVAIAGAGAHLVFGGAGDDTFNVAADAGNYTISGEAGDDTVVNAGSTGALYISGGLGADDLSGGDGNDHIYGNVVAPSGTVADDSDVINAGAGSDYVNGNAGDDSIDGGAGSDRLLGGAGADTILGGTGNGNDSINGNKGDDSIDGGAGNDSLRGGADNDTILGDSGNDVIQGDLGDDSLQGGAGADLVTGGEGADTFFFGAGDALEVALTGTAKAYDTITDFSVADDLLNLDGAPTAVLHVVAGTTTDTFAAAKAAAQALITAGADGDLAAVSVGADTYLFYDSDTVLTPGVIDSYIKLVGVAAADITIDSFVVA